MTPKAKKPSEPRWAGEWVGARREVPVALLSEEDDPNAPPHVIMWLELGNTEPVALVAVDREEPPDAALVILDAAMREPAHGEPRMPRRLRVEDAKLATFLRKHLDAAMEVVSGATPEIDELLESLVRQAADDEGDV